MSDQERKSKQIAGIRFLMGIAAGSKDVSAEKRDELYDIVETVAHDIRNQQEQQEPKMLNHDDFVNRIGMPVCEGNGRTWRVVEDVDAGEAESEDEDDNLYTVCFTDGSSATLNRLGHSGFYATEPKGDAT